MLLYTSSHPITSVEMKGMMASFQDSKCSEPDLDQSEVEAWEGRGF